MSRYTYAGPYKNPTENWYVKSVDEHYEIWVQADREEDGSAEPDHKHTSAPNFDDSEDAEEYIQGMREFSEQDYDDYLDENRYEISQMEAHEDFLNEC